MLNDTTKPGEVLHKGWLDLLTLLHRRDVELHAHLAIVLITVFTIFNSSPILLKGMEKAVF